MSTLVLDDIGFEEHIDMKFGEWLRDQRRKAGMKLEQVTDMTGIDFFRLTQIETGFGKGISRRECVQISLLYKINALDAINRASGIWIDTVH